MSSTTQNTSTTPENSPKPAAPQGHIPLEAGMQLYALWARRGNGKPEMLVFRYKGNLPEAIKRAQLHCTRMDLRFCGTYPFVVDLDMREKHREESLEMEQQY